MIAWVNALLRDRRGSVTVELALFAPILATMIVGVSDISIAFGRKLEIAQASQRAIEKVMQTTGSSTVAETIKLEAVCQVNGADNEGDCTNGRLAEEDVTVTYRLECIGNDGSRTSTESVDSKTFDDLTCGSDERQARYLSVTVEDTYTPMFPVHWGTGDDGVYNLSATAGVRTQ